MQQYSTILTASPALPHILEIGRAHKSTTHVNYYSTSMLRVGGRSITLWIFDFFPSPLTMRSMYVLFDNNLTTVRRRLARMRRYG